MQNNKAGRKYCPITTAQNIIAGKWKLVIISLLCENPKRFNELHRLLPNISQGILTQQLRELERDRLIHREIYKEIPPKVEYSLSEIGRSFVPVLHHISEWGTSYLNQKASANK